MSPLFLLNPPFNALKLTEKGVLKDIGANCIRDYQKSLFKKIFSFGFDITDNRELKVRNHREVVQRPQNSHLTPTQNNPTTSSDDLRNITMTSVMRNHPSLHPTLDRHSGHVTSISPAVLPICCQLCGAKGWPSLLACRL